MTNIIVIKEVLKFDDKQRPDVARIVVRTNTYGSTVGFFQRLFEEVKKDFPLINPEDADIKHYGGRRYKGTYGIEFNVKADVQIPDTYKEISEVEFTL